MSLSALEIAQLINLGGELILAGLKITRLAANPEGLTDEDFKAIIEEHNKHQEEVQDKLKEILGIEDPVGLE